MKDILIAYLHVIKKLKNSDLLKNISVRNIETEDAYDLLYKPVLVLSSIYDRIINNACNVEDDKILSEIRSCSNSIWYSFDNRNDVSLFIPKKNLNVESNLKDFLYSHLSIPDDDPMNIFTIHTIAGEIDMMISNWFKMKLNENK